MGLNESLIMLLFLETLSSPLVLYLISSYLAAWKSLFSLVCAAPLATGFCAWWQCKVRVIGRCCEVAKP